MVRDAIDRRGLRHAFWGQLAGHQHRFFTGRAFDEPEWAGFQQVEVSAVKGDATDKQRSCAFLQVHVSQGVIGRVDRFWREGAEWRNSSATP